MAVSRRPLQWVVAGLTLRMPASTQSSRAARPPRVGPKPLAALARGKLFTGADSQHGAGAVAALAEAVGALDGAALPLARDFAREAKTQRLAESSLARRPNTVETLCILGALLPLRSNLRRTSALAVRVSAVDPITA